MAQIIHNSEGYKSIIDSTKSDFIAITSDKLKLILIDYQDSLKKQKDWKTPCGILVSSAAALGSSSFDSFLGIPGEVWHAIFIIVTLCAIVWLITAGINAVSLFRNKTNTVDSVITRIREESATSSND